MASDHTSVDDIREVFDKLEALAYFRNMTTVSIAEAAKTLPELLERAQTESILIRDENGAATMLVSVRPKTDAEHKQAWDRVDALAREASAMLEESLAKDGLTVEEFLADALADV